MNQAAVAAAQAELAVVLDERVLWLAIQAALPHLSDGERFGEQVDGQGPVWTCGCGYPATEYDGEVLHLLNDALTGCFDHEPEPREER